MTICCAQELVVELRKKSQLLQQLIRVQFPIKSNQRLKESVSHFSVRRSELEESE